MQSEQHMGDILEFLALIKDESYIHRQWYLIYIFQIIHDNAPINVKPAGGWGGGGRQGMG